MDQQPQGPAHTEHKPEHKKLMGVLAYLGILIIIPFLIAKDDPFVKFHLKQGCVLIVIEAIVWILGMTMIGWQLWQLLDIVNLATLILSIIGIVNVVQDKETELPLVGGLAKNFTF
jgi:uncharacterized membrane protein